MHTDETQLLTQLLDLLKQENTVLLSFSSPEADQQSERLERLSSEKIEILQSLQPYADTVSQLINQQPLSRAAQALFDLQQACEKQNYINGELLASYKQRIEWSLQVIADISGGEGEVNPTVYNKNGATSNRTSSGVNHYG